MSLSTVNEPDFSFTFPDGTWTNRSTQEAYDFRCGEQEQVMAVRHLPHKHLAPPELQAAVIELFRVRLDNAQKHSGNSCKFESPTCSESPGKFDVLVFGHDLRQRVFMQFGFFGTPQKIVVVSYYDYSGAASPDRFKQRASVLFASVKILQRA
jgi:hypothetical protein